MKKILTVSLFLIVLVFITGCDRDSGKWKKAQEKNTIQSYQEYLSKYPEGKYAEQAKANKEELAWKATENTDTIESYQLYIEQYPTGKYADKANQQIELLVWKDRENSNTITSLTLYLEKYPTGQYAAEAKKLIEDLAWQQAVSTHTIQSYGEYSKSYPSGKYLSQAQSEIKELTWQAALKSNSIEILNKFIADYPQSIHINEARQQIDSLHKQEKMWAEAETQKTNIALYRKYLETYPDGKYSTQAKDCDAWAKAENAGVDAMDNYVKQYPNGRFVENAAGNIKQLENMPTVSLNRFLDECTNQSINSESAIIEQLKVERIEVFVRYGGAIQTGGTYLELGGNAKNELLAYYMEDMSGRIISPNYNIQLFGPAKIVCLNAEREKVFTLWCYVEDGKVKVSTDALVHWEDKTYSWHVVEKWQGVIVPYFRSEEAE